MAKKNFNFAIFIASGGESYVDYPVTAKERRLILEAIENGEMFEDVDELADLYVRVMEAAKEKLAEDVDLTGDDIDVDDLDYVVEFGEDEEDG